MLNSYGNVDSAWSPHRGRSGVKNQMQSGSQTLNPIRLIDFVSRLDPNESFPGTLVLEQYCWDAGTHGMHAVLRSAP